MCSSGPDVGVLVLEQVLEGLRGVGKVVDEAAVEVAETEEGLEFLAVGRGRPVGDGADFAGLVAAARPVGQADRPARDPLEISSRPPGHVEPLLPFARVRAEATSPGAGRRLECSATAR